MKPWRKMLFVMLMLALAAIACDLPFGQSPGEPAQAPPATAPAAQAQVQLPSATAALSTLLTVTELPQPSDTPSPQGPDFSGVVITAGEMPDGFQEVEASSQAIIGLTQDNLATFFTGNFKQARPANYFAFINGSASNFEMLLGMIFTPLDEAEQASVDSEISDPTLADQVFSTNFGAPAEWIQGNAPVGEKSAGFTFAAETGGQKLRGDLLIVRRGPVAFVVLAIYQEGRRPPVEAAQAASLLDQRLISALTR